MAKNNFDVSLEVINWEREMRRVEQEAMQIAEDDLIGKVEYATKTLREVTPVDTGKARASWRSNIVVRNGEVASAEITSDVDYMEYLNNGSSKQAPSFFIEQVLLRIGVLTED
jgi:hypothetical protein